MKNNKNYLLWVNKAPKSVVDEIQQYSHEDKELYFNKDIEFGTAGMRGTIAWGTNAINHYTISRAAYCYGKLLLKKYGDRAKNDGVVIAHDNRRQRFEFSTVTAEILSALGIKVFFFPKNELQSTPLLSFTIANNDFVGGVNITASHNPPTDNGFKIYNDLGIQCDEEDTKYIQKMFSEVDYFNIEKSEDNIFYLTNDVITNYVDTLMEHIPFDNNVKRKSLKITFTAEHGTATKIAKIIAKKMKVNFNLVKNQCFPDENFINAPTPNPQSMQAYDEAIKVANKNGSTLIFATDPDADRFGVMIKDKNEWKHITGNELPLIQIWYKLNRLKDLNVINDKDFIIRSIVTSSAADKIAKKFGINTYTTLTGFKWIISKALEIEKRDKSECLFAWEESYGSTVRTFTRDKDSFQALIQVIEMSYFYKQQNKSLLDVLAEIYEEIGTYQMFQIQRKFPGAKGMDEMISIIDNFRKKPTTKIGKYKVKEFIDFKKGYKDLPKQNFVMFVFENGSWIALRPSGTEPILRLYFDIHDMDLKPIKEFLGV